MSFKLSKFSNACTPLNDLRKNICLGKSEVSVERNSVHNVIENLMLHDIHTNDVIDMLPKKLWRHNNV